MIQITWDKQEPGWYTHPKLGGICKEDDERWYWYPLGNETGPTVGPFDTLKDAKEAAGRALLYDPTKA